MNTSEVLNRAADLIEERGWGTGVRSMLGSDSGLCIMGALYGAETGQLANDALDETAYTVAETCSAGRAVIEYIGDNWTYMFSWNDATGRTAAEVIEVLRACAVIEASREREAVEAPA